MAILITMNGKEYKIESTVGVVEGKLVIDGKVIEDVKISENG